MMTPKNTPTFAQLG